MTEEKIKKEEITEVKPESGDLKELLIKNLQWSQIIYEQNKRIERKLFIITLWGYFKVLIILVPLILAFIFLPPYIKDFWQTYNQILGGSSELKGVMDIVNQYGKVLK